MSRLVLFDIDGTLLTFPPDARRNPEAASVVAALRKSGNDAEGYTLCTYAAVQGWAAAAAAAGSIDFDKVTAALSKGTFKTVLGDIRFNQKGDATRPGYVLYVWHNGKREEMKP